jgi:hypothetical protein
MNLTKMPKKLLSNIIGIIMKWQNSSNPKGFLQILVMEKGNGYWVQVIKYCNIVTNLTE